MYINDQPFRERVLLAVLAMLRMTLVSQKYLKEARGPFAERNMLDPSTPDLDACIKEVAAQIVDIDALLRGSSHHP